MPFTDTLPMPVINSYRFYNQYNLPVGFQLGVSVDSGLLAHRIDLSFPLHNGQRRHDSITVPVQAIADNPQVEQACVDELLQRANREIRQTIQNNIQDHMGGAGVTGPGYIDYGTCVDYSSTAVEYAGATGACGGAGTGWGEYVSLSPITIGSLSRKFVLNVKIKWGRHTLTVCKQVELGAADNVEITQEDIDQARVNYIKNLNITILTKKAERKAEDLLKTFISDMDFRDFKEKGYFTVKSGNRLFKIYRDSHKWVDTWEKRKDGIFIPKNRLCTHTATRDLPLADEALQKLMLVRSNRIEQYANVHSIDANMMGEIHERDLALV